MEGTPATMAPQEATGRHPRGLTASHRPRITSPLTTPQVATGTAPHHAAKAHPVARTLPLHGSSKATRLSRIGIRRSDLSSTDIPIPKAGKGPAIVLPCHHNRGRHQTNGDTTTSLSSAGSSSSSTMRSLVDRADHRLRHSQIIDTLAGLNEVTRPLLRIQRPTEGKRSMISTGPTTATLLLLLSRKTSRVLQRRSTERLGRVWTRTRTLRWTSRTRNTDWATFISP